MAGYRPVPAAERTGTEGRFRERTMPTPGQHRGSRPIASGPGRGPPRAARRRRRRRRPRRPRAGRLAAARRAPPGRRLRRLRRLRAPGRPRCCPTSRSSPPAEVLAARRPGAADRPRRRAARAGRRASPRPAPYARASCSCTPPGRYGTAVLDPALRAGALPLALHPAMTFTGTPVDVQRLAGCSFGVTAPEELRLAAEALVIEMGGEPEWIAEEARPLYHAALALGANHLVTLVAQSMELLRAAGVEAPDRMLGPLLGAALDNALRSGDAALTGPVARGDAGTVAAHVAELRAHAPADRRRLPGDGPRDRRPRPRARPAQAGARRGPAGRSRRRDGHGAADDRGRRPSRRPRRRRRAGRPLPLRAPPTSCTHARAPAARAVVMTMGALHEGHASLIRTAREPASAPRARSSSRSSSTRSSSARARTSTATRARWTPTSRSPAEAGADVVFAPSVDEVYPGGEPQVRITAGPDGRAAEGASRPGHFDGMLTVVAKLLHLTRPDVALFGQKDAQQLALIRRMVARPELPGRDRRRPDRPRGRTASRCPAATATSRPTSGAPRSRCPGRCSRPRPARRPAGAARACRRCPPRARAEAPALGEARAAADAHAVARRARRRRRRPGRRPRGPGRGRPARPAARTRLPGPGRPGRLHRGRRRLHRRGRPRRRRPGRHHPADRQHPPDLRSRP